jgi:hypothetical protein
MAVRYQTLTFTSGSVTANSSLQTNRTSLPSLFNILKLKVVPNTPGGTARVQIFKKDTFLVADLIFNSISFSGTMVTPIERDTQSERNEGFVVPYEDDDASGELHIQIYNEDSVAKTFTVTVVYEEVATMSSSGGFTLRGPLLLPNGTAGAPSLAFASDTDTGLYRYAADAIGLALAGLGYGRFGLTSFGGLNATTFTVVGNNAASLAPVFECYAAPNDASGQSLGNVEWVNSTNSAGHLRSAAIAGLTEGGTANQRGGGIYMYTKPNASVTLTERLHINSNGALLTNGASNTFGTQGLTINQGVNDDEILSLKSSDVAHGVTAVSDTDTFGLFSKVVAANGGLMVRGLTEDYEAIYVSGIATTADTTKSTAAKAAVAIEAYLKNGTGTTSLGANGNILVIKDTSNVRFILDADGDSHQDIGTAWTNFSTHDDAGLLTALSVLVSKKADPIRKMFGGFLRSHRDELESLKLVKFNKNGHHFVNMSKLLMLTVGAAMQNARKVEAMTLELVDIRKQLSAGA